MGVHGGVGCHQKYAMKDPQGSEKFMTSRKVRAVAGFWRARDTKESASPDT